MTTERHNKRSLTAPEKGGGMKNILIVYPGNVSKVWHRAKKIVKFIK